MSADSAPELLNETQQKFEQLWNLGKGCEYKVIKRSENHTYLVQQQDGARFILRLTPTDHRSQEAIQAEVDYVLLLSSTSADLHLCKPIPLANGQYIATGIMPYQDKHEYFAVLFEFAKGVDIMSINGLMNDTIIAAYGRTLALMHQGISKKANNAEKWDGLCKQIPLCSETHNGATDIEKTVRIRANAGHNASKLLLRIWEQKVAPFLESLGAPTAAVYGPVHGDLNVSNFFAQLSEDNSKADIYVFDFDQVQMNWFGFDIGVILKMVLFFEENKWIPNFEAKHFSKVFIAEYEKYAPEELIKAGHTSQEKLDGFIAFREFYHTGVAVDILFQAENGKVFEANIVNFCKMVVSQLEQKYAQ